MVQYLPLGGFKWLSKKEINDFCLDSISENNSVGYILEVSLVDCMTCIMITY